MSSLYHLARADFLERTRRYSFLITLGLVVFLGYLVYNGTIDLRLDDYRGVYNSAWLGALMALVVNTFLGLFGFYLVKGAVERDRQTGVGQIMAATPLRRVVYLIGKWLSNLAVLGLLIVVLALAALGMQLIQREDPRLDLGALFAPFLFVSLPMMALIAATAVLFETIAWLRGGLGNVVYFIVWNMALVFSITTLAETAPGLDPSGIGLYQNAMGAAVRAFDPAYQNGFSLGSGETTATRVFVWPGLEWTPDLILSRLALVGVALGIVLLAAVFFDRFETTGRPARSRPSPTSAAGPARRPRWALSPSLAEAWAALAPRSTFLRVLAAELRLLLQGRRWWWYAVGVVLTFIPLGVAADGLTIAAGLAWIWPLTLWSALGAREARYQTTGLLFSAAHPVRRQLPAAWLAGVLVTAAAGLGVAGRLAQLGDLGGLFTWTMGVLFVPALALALGVWSGGSKLFEVVYVVLWYLGPMNGVAALNYISGPASTGLVILAATALLLAVAALGRQRQLRAA